MEKNLIHSIDLASFGEEHACRFLLKNKYTILERNYRIPQGEIDIVARKGDVIAFVEVKTRATSAFAQPWEAVGHHKRKRLRIAAKAYIRERSVRNLEFRFDVISITLNEQMKPELEWIQAAF